MARLAFLQFYPNDWLADPAVRACSVAARGLWMDMLSLMHLSARRGYLLAASGTPLTPEQLARLTGCSAEEVSRLLAELQSSGVFSCTDDGTIFSRRMVRDEGKREKCSSAGRKGGGNPTFKGQRKGGSKGDTKGTPKPPETRDQRPIEVTTLPREPLPAPKHPATRKQADSPHARSVAFWCDSWADKYGDKFPFNGGKDGEAIRAILAHLEGDEAKFREVVSRYLADPDDFAAGKRHPLGLLRSQLATWLGDRPARAPRQPNLFGLDYAGRTESRILAQVAESLLPQPPE
jgi:hypothetical protein